MIGLRARAGLVLAFVFAAGMVGGVAIERHHFAAPPRAPSPEEVHVAAMADLIETLELDEDQVAQVHSIIASNHAVVQGAWEELRPQVRDAMAQVNQEIAELLRPDQRERFHDWLSERSGHGTTFTFHER